MMKQTKLAGLSILVLEDETLLRKQITAGLERLGADVTGAKDLQSARNFLGELSFDFALTDVNLPDGKGTDLLQEGLLGDSTATVIMTAEGGVLGAVEAMKLGALDYLIKPFDPEELPLVIERARKTRQNRRLDEHRRGEDVPFFFGTALAPLEAQLQKILAADKRMQTRLAPVLIEGETGTGKTSLARWLHAHGPRAGSPLVEVNCSALPETLAESELFGHERGAFTDARTARIGLFEAASGGTLFMDELASLSLAMQAKVLSAIEDHRIRRLGGNKEIPIDVRIIAASNRKLRELIAEGAFREDLLHRLDLFRLVITPLRDRSNDIIHLAKSLISGLCSRHRMPLKTISEGGSQQLLKYPWPGNVRELAHELERAIVFEDGGTLNFEHLVGNADREPRTAVGLPDDEWFNPNFRFPDQGFNLETAVNRLIEHALNQSAGNVSAAARLLAVTRDYLRYRLEEKPKRQAEEKNQL